MNDDQLTTLRNRFQRRRDRLNETNILFFRETLGRFLRFLQAENFFATILNELKADRKAETNATVIQAMAADPRSVLDARKSFESATQEDHVPLLYHLLIYSVQHPNNINHITDALYGSNADYHRDDCTGFKKQVLLPFCDYLEDRLDEAQGFVGLLLRYKKRCEWYNRQPLLDQANKAQAKATDKKRAEVEAALKQDLYLYLHDQGLDFTVEPCSPDGRIDVILSSCHFSFPIEPFLSLEPPN